MRTVVFDKSTVCIANAKDSRSWIDSTGCGQQRRAREPVVLGRTRFARIRIRGGFDAASTVAHLAPVPAGGAYRVPAGAQRRARDRRGPGARHAPGVGLSSAALRAKRYEADLRRLHGGQPEHHHRARGLRLTSRCVQTANVALGSGTGPDVLYYAPGPGYAGVLAEAGSDPPSGRPGRGVRLERARRRGRARAGEDRRRALRPAARDRPHRHVRQPHHPRPGGVGDPRDDRRAGRLLWRGQGGRLHPDGLQQQPGLVRPITSSPSPATT